LFVDRTAYFWRSISGSYDIFEFCHLGKDRNTQIHDAYLGGRILKEKHYRILIIEDDLEHAELIKMGFRRHDEFFLDFASTGEQGLEMIVEDAYDLISVDLVLPGIGGLDVLVRIRKLDPDIPCRHGFRSWDY
jgi:PleD family two-component response regulator